MEKKYSRIDNYFLINSLGDGLNSEFLYLFCYLFYFNNVKQIIFLLMRKIIFVFNNEGCI